MIQQFGIKFGDNDFHRTFASMLPVIAKGIYNRRDWSDFYKEWQPVHKEIIAKMVSEFGYTFYRLSQNMWEYNFHEDDERIKEYFHVNPDKVFIDDELVEYIGKYSQTMCNADLFCVTVCEEPYFWRV